MNKILKRDEFIEEVYNPMIEQKEYEELVSINEGLLKTLFGAVKNLFVQDWKSIKCDNPEIIKIYKELDDALTGFSMMKLSKKKECNQIRQELVDFAYDWYDKKMNDAKKDDVDPKPAKGMKFRDETLKSNLEATQDKINTICGEDAQMKKWANMLMSDMKVVINRSILEYMKDPDAKDELEAKNNEDMEKLNQKHEKTNKEMEKLQNDQLKEVKKERDKIINDMNATPTDENLSGDKTVKNMCGAFDQVRVSVTKAKKAIPPSGPFKNDKLLGFNGIFADEDYGTDNFKVTYKLLDSFYTSLNSKDVIEQFKKTPAGSVQAMCISINAFIKHSVYGDKNYDNVMPLMAKCAVVSDGTVGFSIPVTKDDNGKDVTFFSKIAFRIANKEFKDVKNKDIEYPQDFEKNANDLLKKIGREAERLKKKADRENKKISNKINAEEEI